MNKDFNYKKFIQYVHEKFSDLFSEEDIENLFELKDSYEKDDPKSQGKILSINELIFSGIKSNQDSFSYQRKFQKGINTWIADNLKGKSTIFKIIKYCLTGDNTIKSAIKNWFKDFLLEFSLASDIYTIHIDTSAKRVNCELYKFTIEEYTKFKEEDKLNLINLNTIFTAASEKEFKEKIEDFFFNELSFYTLQYRHRPGLKNESVEANLSWQTYFKSIYLESSNYKYLYFEKENIGRQGTKILEMLLGLRLTYPINQLTLLRDMKDEKVRNAKYVLEENKKANKDDLGELTNELQDIENKLAELNKQKNFQSFEGILKEYVDLEASIAKRRIERNKLQFFYDSTENQMYDLDKEIKQYSNSIKVRENEIKRIDKDIIQNELFVETGSFFTNLEVHECPHCDNPVSAKKKIEERDSHVCSLCGTNVIAKKSDDKRQKENITKLNTEKDEIIKNIESLKKQLLDKQNNLKGIKSIYAKTLVDLQKYLKIDEEEQRLNHLGNTLRQQTEEQKQYQEALSKKNSYIQKQAILQYRINELKKIEANALPDEIDKLDKEVNVLNYGIDGLKAKRAQLNKEMLETFQNLILAQIQEFGTTSITGVRIDEKYDLVLVQHDSEEKFEDLVEGEKLRVKLAFYLSIIQLDIDHQLGRHPRFLIFDAPGSEEMIPSHLHGLIENFKSINRKFQDNLQIFIGSAVRDFSEVTDISKSEIKEEDTFLF